MVMWLSIFGSEYGVGNTNGVNPAAVHRIAVSAATTFDSLPHSAHIAQGLALFKTDHKESYKYTFVLTVVFPVIFSLVAVIGSDPVLLICFHSSHFKGPERRHHPAFRFCMT